MIGELGRKAGKGLRVARRPGYWRGLRHGVAASIEHSDVPLPGEIATVIDAGANRGQFMLFACERFPAAEIICFEPLAAPRAKLARVIPAGRSVTVLPYALSDSAGTVPFHVAEADDSSSLLEAGGAQLELSAASREAAVIEVETRRLDAVPEVVDPARPALLKIDVQGGELGLLRGATGLLASIDYVFVECSFVELYKGQPLYDEVAAFLASEGFVQEGRYSSTRAASGELIQADVLFVRADRERE